MAEQMKESGIQWIGAIPYNWNVERIKHIIQNNDNGIKVGPFGSALTNEVVSSDEGKYKVYGQSNLIRKDFSYGDNYVSEQNYKRLINYEVLPNDIAVSMMGTIGKCSVVPGNIEPGIMDSHLIKIRLSQKMLPRYFEYAYESDMGYSQLLINSKGSIMNGLNSTIVKGLYIPVPEIIEQQAIVDFLDKECAQIDSIAADLEKQIALLQQYKKSLITETVTKGLDKSVPMKDSGVEWIGEIPNTWDCKKMKYVISEPLQYGANEAGDDYKEDYPRYIRITDITEENSLKDAGKLSLSPDIAKPYLLKDGDLLFARSGATVGKTFYYTSNYGTCAFAGYLIKARFNQDKMNPKFVYYTTLGIGYENWKNTVFTQATIQNIGADKYAQLYITVPSMKEQNEIIAYLDTQCKAIDDVIHSKYQQLSTIQQHKKSLIYEYVTGKKRVKEVR